MQDKQQSQIIEMFNAIAPKYDLANRAMSLGIDRIWRKEACSIAFSNLMAQDIVIADIACGSGDMIKHWIENAPKNTQITKIYAYDPSSQMLKVAQEKLKNYPQVEILQGEAKSLPFADSSIDILSISFGLRNVIEYKQALDEFARVLKKEGILVILEFLKPQKNTLLHKLMGFYTNKILPLIGGLISSNLKAYRYLPQSMQKFISIQELQDLLHQRGIKTILTKGYNADVSTLYIGIKQ